MALLKKETLTRQGDIIIVVMMQKAALSEKSCDGFCKIKKRCVTFLMGWLKCHAISIDI